MEQKIKTHDYFAKQKLDQVLIKGKHPLSCAQHLSWNPQSQIRVNVNPKKSLLTIGLSLLFSAQVIKCQYLLMQMQTKIFQLILICLVNSLTQFNKQLL